ncbi:MAG: exopolysaccharide biosynthesis polyprenyl glycosylphosphotransferase [Bdellovibrionales bacterium]|nr:exopolysaccharide biosynthesis polyprenyl glycosylphosphotransferase [Bdellovibrionales bacterium]
MLAKRSFRADVPFFCLLSLVWVVFFTCVEFSEPNDLSAMVIFSLGAGCFSYALLKLMGYFDPVRLLPRKSSLLLLPIAVLFGSYLQYLVFSVFGLSQPASLQTILTGTPVLSLVIFGGHYFLDWRRLHSGRKRRIVLNLSDKETKVIRSDFANIDGAEHLEFLTIDDLSRAIHENRLSRIDLIVTSENGDDSMKAQAILVEAHVQGTAILDYRSTSSALIRRIRLSEHCLWSYVVNATQQTALLRLYSLTKPLVEPIFAAFLALALLPLMVVIAVLVKVTSKGPALFVQTRTGFRGAPFKLVKFRSMYTDAEKNGVQFAQANDRRITPLGNFLRKTRLDELPQLWNVMRGDMSFIGPRPERPEIYAQLQEQLPMFWLRTIVKPGVTGWAQVYRGYVDSLEGSRTKLEFDMYYIQHRSPRLDIIILLKTLKVSLFGSERLDEESSDESLWQDEQYSEGSLARSFLHVAESVRKNRTGSTYLTTVVDKSLLDKLSEYESNQNDIMRKQVPARGRLAAHK